MKTMHKGFVLAAAQLALILSLGGKLLFDRATQPRAWVKAAPVDPDLPIRGRYVSLQVEVPIEGAELPPERPRPTGLEPGKPWPPTWEELRVRVKLVPGGEGLRAVALKGGLAESNPSTYDNNASIPHQMRRLPREQWIAVLDDRLAFFIPEHVPDPSRRPAGEELWVEVTLPRKGPLRPIRLGVKKDGVLNPLDL